MYSLKDYGRMLSDRVRMRAYVRALEQTVRPGSVVADLGAGTGIFSLHACRLGARHVYAVDMSPAMTVAAAAAKANGFSERITCIQADCLRTYLPEKVDIVIGDLRGTLPFFPGNLEAFAHAQRHWLKPGGTLIPKRDVLKVALVRDRLLYEKITGPWRHQPAKLDLSIALKWAVNQFAHVHLKGSALASAPKTWGSIDYGAGIQRNAQPLSWKSRRRTTAYGLAVWFDAELTATIGFSNRPGSSPAIYGQAFLPFENPLTISAGESLQADIQLTQLDDYLWSWQVEHRGSDGAVRRTLRQSMFLGMMLTTEALKNLRQ
ncbi:MAG TPA: class I SAM-dependent methyltransferase [Verrucomicrobiae bacterium]|nr:class I SAM-dependent methyltransferase [Verrucomicrobiae bacterium]